MDQKERAAASCQSLLPSRHCNLQGLDHHSHLAPSRTRLEHLWKRALEEPGMARCAAPSAEEVSYHVEEVEVSHSRMDL